MAGTDVYEAEQPYSAPFPDVLNPLRYFAMISGGHCVENSTTHSFSMVLTNTHFHRQSWREGKVNQRNTILTEMRLCAYVCVFLSVRALAQDDCDFRDLLCGINVWPSFTIDLSVWLWTSATGQKSWVTGGVNCCPNSRHKMIMGFRCPITTVVESVWLFMMIVV